MIELLIITTLVNTGIFALLAVGFSLIFGVARVLNMAHTAFYAVAAYIFFYFIAKLMGIQMPVVPAIIIVVVVVTLLGMLSYKLFINPVREHHGAVLLITIALAMSVQEVLTWIFAAHNRTVPSFVPGTIQISGITVTNQHIVTLAVAAVLIIGVYLFLSKTKMGTAIRAVANDTEIASLMGISPSRVLMITMTIATALAALAAVLRAPFTTIRPDMWGTPLLTIMVVVIIGGLGSIKGSIIGAFILGFVEALCLVDPLRLFGGRGSYLITTFAMLAMVIVLIVRPAGLFGTLFEEEKL